MTYLISFYACITFIVLGAVLGILGLWVPAFQKDERCYKLFVTDAILFVASLAVAIITKMLG